MVRYTKLLSLALSLTLVLAIGLAQSASAKTIKGTAKNDVLTGTKKADRIDGRGGNDKIRGKGGNDVLIGGKGKDKIDAGAGDDTIKAKDGKRDAIVCGPGTDKVIADAIDKLAADCEGQLPVVPGPTPSTPTAAITVVVTGGGSVTSSPAGISCGLVCAGVFNVGTQVTLSPAPDLNRAFVGWGGACSGTGTCVVTADTSKGVTATFGPVQHIVGTTIDGAGSGTVSSTTAGISCPGDCSEPIAHGSSITLTATAANGSTFAGWSGAGCSGPETCTVSPTSAASVVATFTLNNYALTQTRAGTGTGTITSSPLGITCGVDCTELYSFGTQVTLTAAAGVGSNFAGWSGGGCSGTGTCVVTISAATNVTATFNQAVHQLTITKAGNGTGNVSSSPSGIACGVDCSMGFTHGTVVTLTALAGSGSSFAGWSGGGCSGTGTCVVTLTAATTVTASFTLNAYALTQFRSGTGTGNVTSSPTGINCGVDCSELYLYGTVVTLTAVPSSTSDFTGWSGGGCSGTGTCQVTVSAATSVTANFSIQTRALTVVKSGNGSGVISSSPAGINCGADCGEVYNIGTSVTLTASPVGGTNFIGWSGGGCSGTGTCTVTLNSATTVTATFTLSTHLLQVEKSGVGSGTVTSSPGGISCGADCSELFNFGEMVTLTAVPDGNSTFNGWSGACTGTGTCTVSISAAANVNALFLLVF